MVLCSKGAKDLSLRSAPSCGALSLHAIDDGGLVQAIQRLFPSESSYVIIRGAVTAALSPVQ